MKVTYANEKREKKIRELLEDGEKRTKDLAEHLDIRQNTLARHLKRMEKSRIVKNTGRDGLHKEWSIL